MRKEGKDLFARFGRPAFVGDGAGGAGMQDGAYGECFFRNGRGCFLELLKGVGSDTDEERGLQDSDEADEVTLTGGIDLLRLGMR